MMSIITTQKVIQEKPCPKVGIVILNWNTWEDTIECLESLFLNSYPNYITIVIDNASKDESIKKIKEYCQGDLPVKSNFVKYHPENKPIKYIEYTREEALTKKTEPLEFKDLPSSKKVVIIKNEKNYGFPEGNNIGMRYALNCNCDYVLLLNNDTVVDKEFLTEMIKVAERDNQIGLTGSKIYYYYHPTKIQSTGGRIRWAFGDIINYGNVIDNGQYDIIEERDYFTSNSLLIKKMVIENISFIDPTFFFGQEEYDYCTRAKRNGWKLVYVPSSKIWHKVGSSKLKLSMDKDTLNVIKKTGGFMQYKYEYKLFKRYCPPIIFVFSFILRLLIRALRTKRNRIEYLKKYFSESSPYDPYDISIREKE